MVIEAVGVGLSIGLQSKIASKLNVWQTSKVDVGDGVGHIVFKIEELKSGHILSLPDEPNKTGIPL